MNGNKRQSVLLIVLAVVLLIASLQFAGSMLGFGEDAETLPVAVRRPAAGAPTGRLGTHPGDRVAMLRVADLERAPRESTSGRDLWRFVDPPPQPKRHAPAVDELPATGEASPARPAGPAPGEVKPDPYPEFKLRYLGRFGPPSRQIAVFANGKAVVNAQEGDVIDDKFIVAHIGYESVEIRFVGFPDAPAKRVGVTPRPQGRARGNPGAA
jgi:hypothetical protein